MTTGIEMPLANSSIPPLPNSPTPRLPMKLSVIIPAYNEEAALPATLEARQKALSRSATQSELIVVDNNSTDKTSAIAKEFGAVVVNETEHNIGKVRNTGARHAAGDVLVFIDADTLVPETLFETIVDLMKDETCCGGAFAVGYGDFKRWWMSIYMLGWRFWGKFFNMAQGAAQFYRRSAFDAAGGYDESIYMGEDIEFYWRVSKFARQSGGYLELIDEPRVVTSTRRFDKMSLWRTLLLTHPIFIRLAWRKRSFWKDWYDDPVR